MKKKRYTLVVCYQVMNLIEKLYRNGSTPVEQTKAVTKTRCNRCLSTNIYRDEQGICHCLDCFQYGEVNETMTLYRFSRETPLKNHTLHLSFQLTKLQKQGADFLLNCYLHHESGFLQAVCGAGKTEMTFQTILAALKKNQKVCFVLPRVEVLKEVSKRFKAAFPHSVIGVLYEGNKQYDDAQFIISTPQQLIYFYKEFDLMIIDEVDAFPYSGNKFLERLVQKSLKKSAVILYMSATISKTLEEKIGNIKTFLIPSRYHYKDMIVPKFKRIKQAKSIFKCLKPYIDKNVKTNKKALLFVPTIKIGEYMVNSLKEGYRIGFICSKTNDKEGIIEQFRNQEITLLITTTVLERGVTFSNIDVYVLFADHRVFNKESLIQISGRVGRDLSFSDGALIYFSEYVSKEMKQAKNEIIYMNLRNKLNEVQTL